MRHFFPEQLVESRDQKVLESVEFDFDKFRKIRIEYWLNTKLLKIMDNVNSTEFIILATFIPCVIWFLDYVLKYCEAFFTKCVTFIIMYSTQSYFLFTFV